VADVEVRRTQSQQSQPAFQVTVREGPSQTAHEVTISEADLGRLARPGEEPTAFIERCFEFLLQREPKESIMSTFDISIIDHYFPEFEATIRA
jgi:hypothetical protein